MYKKLRKSFLATKPYNRLLLATVCIFTCLGFWLLIHGSGTGTINGTIKPLAKVVNSAITSTAPVAPGTALEVSENVDKFDYEEQLVVMYNRVPKTGSTSFVNIGYDLCKRNKFHMLHINVTSNMHVLSLANQISLARNITKWHEMKPALYHGHVAFLDFSKFQIAHKPIYINIIRQPLERFVSYYYFLRSGDNYRPNLVRKKAGNKITFDKCVESKQPDCDPKNMWIQIPFFCGHAAECWEPGSEWAFNEAKRNLVNEYFLVGVTEQMESFVDLLERSLPRMFHGFREYYQNSNKSHLRQTSWKIAPSNDTINVLKQSKIWQMENKLYEFALAQFEFTKRKLSASDNKPSQKFMFEKIRPK